MTSQLRLKDRATIFALAWDAECAVANATHLVRGNLEARPWHASDLRAMPHTVDACVELGRAKLREYVAFLRDGTSIADPVVMEDITAAFPQTFSRAVCPTEIYLDGDKHLCGAHLSSTLLSTNQAPGRKVEHVNWKHAEAWLAASGAPVSCDVCGRSPFANLELGDY